MTTDARVRFSAEDRASAVFKRIGDNAERLQQKLGQVQQTTGTSLGGFAAPLERLLDSGRGIARLAGGLGLIGGAAGAAALGLGATAVVAAKLANDIDDLSDAAQGLGTTAVALSELRASARLAGVDSGALDRALVGLSGKIGDAAAGGKEAQAVFRRLGIEIKDAAGNVRPTEAVLRDVADRVSGFGDGINKTNLLVDLFGQKVGPRLAAFLNQGGDALRANTGLTEEAVIAARKLAEEQDKLALKFERVKNAIAGFVIPKINAVLDFGAGPSEENAPERRLERINGRIAQLRALTQQRQNPEVLEAINDELRQAVALSAQLGQSINERITDRFLAGSRAARQFAKPDAPAREGKDEGKSEGQSFLDSLRKRVQLQEQGEFASLRTEAAQKGVARAAEQYIVALEKARLLQDELKRIGEDVERDLKRSAEAGQFARSVRERVAQIEAEAAAIGKTRLEVERLTAVRQIDAQLETRLEALRREKGDTSVEQARARADAAAARTAAERAVVERAIREQGAALDDLLRDIELEISLVGASNGARQEAILLRDLEKSGIDKQSDAYAKLVERIQQIGAAIDFGDKVRAAEQAFNELGSAIASNVENAIVKWEGFGNLLKSIEQDILRIVTRNLITEPLGNAISGLLKGAPGAGGGGGIAGILGSIGSALFGGGRAYGGPVSAGRLYEVNERRAPELLSFGGRDFLMMSGSGGRVSPAAAGAQQARVLNVQNTFVLPPGGYTTATQQQVATDAAQSLQLALARFG